MMAPRGRLVWVFAVVGWPALTLLALYPELAPLCLFVIGTLAVVVVSDAVLSRDRLRNIRIIAPELVRFAKGRAGEIELRVRNEESTRVLPVRIAITPPRDFSAKD